MLPVLMIPVQSQALYDIILKSEPEHLCAMSNRWALQTKLHSLWPARAKVFCVLAGESISLPLVSTITTAEL